MRKSRMDEILSYIRHGTFPDARGLAKKVIQKGIQEGRPHLLCATSEQRLSILMGIHYGVCGSHFASWTLS